MTALALLLAITKVGIIGLDTSHAIAFTKIMNVDKDPGVAGFRMVAAYQWGSKDIVSSTNRYPKYIAEVQKMGVEVVPTIDELIAKVDVVCLETNDGREHLWQAEKVFQAGKPVFIDKPIAHNLHDAIKIHDAGKKYGWQGANYVNVGPGATLTDSLLTGSKTTNWKEGYVLSCKGGLVRNCRIVDNHSDDARIFYLAYDSGIQRPGRMEGCVITNNSSFYSFCDFSGAVVVEDCLFEKNNTAYNNGNYPLISLPASAVLRRCRILRNKIQATLIGCNGWDLDYPARIENCLIADNTLTSKGGYVFYVTPNVNAAASVLNTTIVNNQGGGIYYGNNVGVAYPSQFYMTNSVVWANYPVGATVATNVIGTVAKPKLAHNCYSEAVEDDGNFNTAQDPQLRAFGRKIYRLTPSSPCVGKGDPSLWTADDVDLLGNPRLTKGKVDMGCYELIVPGLMLLVK